eukprot:952825-Rhodomonas_salina.1
MGTHSGELPMPPLVVTGGRLTKDLPGGDGPRLIHLGTFGRSNVMSRDFQRESKQPLATALA